MNTTQCDYDDSFDPLSIACEAVRYFAELDIEPGYWQIGTKAMRRILELHLQLATTLDKNFCGKFLGLPVELLTEERDAFMIRLVPQEKNQ